MNFYREDVCSEYFKFIRTIYNADLKGTCDIFGVADIVKLMLRLTKADEVDYQLDE